MWYEAWLIACQHRCKTLMNWLSCDYETGYTASVEPLYRPCCMKPLCYVPLFGGHWLLWPHYTISAICWEDANYDNAIQTSKRIKSFIFGLTWMWRSHMKAVSQYLRQHWSDVRGESHPGVLTVLWDAALLAWCKILSSIFWATELSILSFFFPLAHKSQVWKGWFLWEAGETGRGFICYSLQRKEQVSRVCMCTPYLSSLSSL